MVRGGFPKLGMPADTKTDEFSEKLEKAFNPLLFSVLSDQRISERQEIPCLCCFIWPKDFRETNNFISMLFSVCPCLHQAVRSNLLLLCNCRQHPLKITSTFQCLNFFWVLLKDTNKVTNTTRKLYIIILCMLMFCFCFCTNDTNTI